MRDKSVLVRARVPALRLRKAEHVLGQLGLKTSDAINMLMAHVVLRQGLPFDMTVAGDRILTSAAQAAEWTEALGEY